MTTNDKSTTASTSDPVTGTGTVVSGTVVSGIDVRAIMASGSFRARLAAVGVIVALALLPFIGITVPGVFSGALNSPGTLVVLATGLVYAGVAMSYDLLLGYTGLLSLGHALYFAAGLYATALLLDAGWSLVAAAVVAVIGVAVLAALLGSVALRVDGVAFAMVTLAFAEAFWISVNSDPLRITNGEEGLALPTDAIPELLRGVVNTRWVFWTALAFAVVAWVATHQIVGSRAGHVYRAVRDNPERVEMLGLRPYGYKLQSFVLGGAIAGLGGVAYLLVVRGASPNAASTTFTLNLVVMVVLGGVGRLWGAALGGMLFAWLELRLPDLAGSGTFDALPDVISTPLSEPLFILGALFVLLMMFVPGGLASVIDRLRTTVTR